MNTKAIAILETDKKSGAKRIKIFLQQDLFQIIGEWDSSMYDNNVAVYTNPQADIPIKEVQAIMNAKLLIAKERLDLKNKDKGVWIES